MDYITFEIIKMLIDFCNLIIAHISLFISIYKNKKR